MISNNILNFLKQKKINQAIEKRNIKSVTFEILTACNFKCVHCYNQDLETRCISLELFKHILSQLVDAGCESITLTGGEPLLHPNFKEIYIYCVSKNLKIDIFTNGFYIDKFIDLFKVYKPNKVEISLYGTNNNTYSNICKITNGFVKVYNNIKLLKKNNINTKLKTIVMEQNFEEFDEMNLICENLGLPFKFDVIILKSKNFSNDQSNNVLNKNYYNFMEKVKEQNLEKWKNYPKSFEERNTNEYIYKCYAGKRSAFITSAGAVRICNFAEFSEKDLTKMSFKEAWDTFDKYLYIKEDKSSKCYNCKYKCCCSNCPVSTYMNLKTNGDVVLPVEQNCREAKFIYESISTDYIK